MSTLIAFKTSSGESGRCDSRCYGAIGPDCHCLCGGMNHGVGFTKAQENMRNMWSVWVREHELRNPGVSDFTWKINSNGKMERI